MPDEEPNQLALEFEVVAPDPGGTINSLGALGYSLEAAVADLIDNSVAADARQVWVETDWNDGDPWLAVVDDGRGMDAATLRTAMMIAGTGPTADRGPSDLGRFGLGLKTASFSQARQLIVSTTVSTRSPQRPLVRTWDLDVVEATREWRLLHGAATDSEPVLARLHDRMAGSESGTVVLWRRLTRLSRQPRSTGTSRVGTGRMGTGTTDGDGTGRAAYYNWLTALEQHLAMTFHRYLSRSARTRLKITVNDVVVQPWDPFQTRFSQTEHLPHEVLTVAGRTVAVAGYVLPHRRHLSEADYVTAAGPRGWLAQQGFYVYRRDRIIVAGGWLGLSGLRVEERFQLARIAVNVPTALDHAWSLDVRKATASPPGELTKPLLRIALHARRAAGEALGRRLRVLSSTNAPDRLGSPWQVRNDDGTARCLISRDHPLVRRLAAAGDAATVEATLRLLERTVPVALLRVIHEPDRRDPEPFDADDDQTRREVATQLYGALLAQGVAAADARSRVARIPWLVDLPDPLAP